MEGPQQPALTFFDRLEGETEEDVSAPPTGGLGGFFGRLFRGDLPASVPSTSEEQQPQNLQVIVENEPSESPQVVALESPSAISRVSVVSQDTDGSLTPKRKSSRLASLFKKDKNGLVDYNRSSFRQYWMPDSTGKECYQCEEKFTALRRRHHCRLCGQIFCAKCCNTHIAGAPLGGIKLGYIGDLRLCGYCAKMVKQHVDEDETRNSSEEMLPPVLLQSAPERIPSEASPPTDGHSLMASSVATVSAGSLMWSREKPRSRKNSLSLPPPNYHPPSMLCVQELYANHTTEPKFRIPRGSNGHLSGEEDECEPDWVKSLDLMAHGQHDALKAQLDCPTPSHEGTLVHFDLGPLTIESEDSPETEPSPLHKQASLEHKESLSVRRSLSPTEPLQDNYINENDVDKLFDHKAVRLLDYLFLRENLDKESWYDLVLNTAREVAQRIEVDVVKRKDNMNVLQYVHVKKLVVDVDKPSAETIWGVACSKSVTHSEMAGDFQNASVMIVAGSIEYERIPGKLSNLEPIINQESEFLSKQVERILASKPSLLLVEHNVSRVAADLLREAGVRLVVGLKKQVLARVARATNADILPSGDAQLMKQNIETGYCPLFTQREVVETSGRKRILLVFDKCAPDRGCSILLKSRSRRELCAVKRVLQYMVVSLYSAKLEKAYLALYNCKLAYQISTCEVCEARRENIEIEVEDENSFLGALQKSCLSISPYIEFEPPFLETPKGRTCTLLPYFKQPLYKFGVSETFVANAKHEEDAERAIIASEKTCPVPVYPRHPFALPCRGEELNEATTSKFRAFSGLLFQNRLNKKSESSQKSTFYYPEKPSKREDVLDPYVHQRLAILFGSFSPKSPNAPLLCVRPWVVSMQFYGANDMTLGEFLTRFCFSKDYQCPSSNCELPMLEHSRKIVFGRVCIEITTTVVQNGMTSDESNTPQRIYTYHYCEHCKAASPIVSVDSRTWHLSFAKFLDYIGNAGFSLGNITGPLDHPCHHCFFHQQSYFFSFNNYATCFKVSKIQPLHVQFSPVVCRIQSTQVSVKSLDDMLTRTAKLGDDICTTAATRLLALMQHESSQYASTFHTPLKVMVESTRKKIKELLESTSDVRSIEEEAVNSTNSLAVKATEVQMQMRDVIYQLITTWNEQCQVLSASLRAMKKNTEDAGTNGEATDVCLDRLCNPFPSYLHLSLPLSSRVGVTVRDIQDGKSESKPDIGSIIAYALSSDQCVEGQRKAREALKDGDVPLNINSIEHVEIEFQDSQTSFYVKAYYAERFRRLRGLLFPDGEEAFIRSLALSTFWTPQGGKSGAFFYRTMDHRFVIKQMSKFEVQSFIKFAPRYFEYIETAVTEKKLTTLCKVFGMFRVGYKNKTTGVQVKTDILVMEYLFYKHQVDQVWDLKGSLRNRMASAGKSSSELVLMDENFMKDLWNNQLYVFPHSKAALNQAISNDSHFLSAQDVMDYSLLVGVDSTNGELILGIVDYMRTYTLDKKLESLVKMVAIPGSHLPTVISPEMYCTRFSEAMDTYFPVVPDLWTGLGSTISY